MVDSARRRVAHHHLTCGAAFLAGMVACPPLGLAQDLASAEGQIGELRDLTIEQLANIEITSVSRRPESVSQAPSSIYVITNEDVLRAEARTLPEVLRLAPNLEVGRIDAQNYAISARGFNTYQTSNKLLVLIDGRSVYTPLYSSVFWDQQHVLLDDIDRVEVMSGPGGALWGANAVNGVINVVSRAAQDTQGWLARATAGTLDQGASLRYGGALGESGAFRVYAQGYEYGESTLAGDVGAGDDWNNASVGFRADWGGLANTYTLQGDAYQDRYTGGRNQGGNVLARWRRLLSDGSRLEVQAYHTRAERDATLNGAPGAYDLTNTTDIEFQHNFSLGRSHNIVWGGGHRTIDSEFFNTANPFGFERPERTLHMTSLFVQDQITLAPAWALTFGIKVEDHTFTDIEYMPSARLAWRPSETMMVWAAVSRAVRTPSRIDEELSFPGFIEPNRFHSEELTAYEIGYRAQASARLTFSLSGYYHDYDELRTSSLTPPGVFPSFVGNGLEGEIYGLEGWGDYAVTDFWRVSAGLTLLDSTFRTDPYSADLNGSGDDPSHQFFLRSRAALSDTLNLDLNLRAIADLPKSNVPSYVELGGRLGWRLTPHLELALVGENLLDESHPESFDTPPLRDIGRALHVTARWVY